MEHCNVIYYSKNIGRIKETNHSFEDGRDFQESSRKYWNDFLAQMAQERWELAAAVSLSNGVSKEIIAHFKRTS